MMMNAIQSLLFGARLRPLRLAAFAGLLLVVGWLALTPVPPKDLSTGWDKANHALAFATLLVSGRLAWPGRPLAVGLGLLAYGGAIELLQLNIPGRAGEWADLLADAVGLGVGFLAYATLQSLLTSRWR